MKDLQSLHISDTSISETDKLARRQVIVGELNYGDLSSIFDKKNLPDSVGRKNCENWIGSVAVPVGLAGPVLVDGKQHYIPMATTEGALVASVSRGCKALTQSDGVTTFVDKKGMSRAPVFVCKDAKVARNLQQFLDEQQAEIARVAEKTSGHIKYLSNQSWVRGRHVYVRFVFDTDEAMGMNMTTIATQEIASLIERQVDGAKLLALSSNVCTDKKDNLINSVFGRGLMVQVEAFLKNDAIKQVLKTNSEAIFNVHLQKNLIGSNIAGSFSQNAQVANVLSAVFIATGQDPAHVVEGSKAFLTVEKQSDGLYVSLSMPNLNMGTVGGGTYLPAQSEARKIISRGESLTAQQLAGLTASACLGGEISLLASLSNHTLACAHQTLGRDNK